MQIKRKYPIGAELIPEKGVHFRIWAPQSKKVFLRIHGVGEYEMLREKKGYFSFFSSLAKEGSFYDFRIEKKWLSDPASFCQPMGVKGASCVINSSFPWSDSNWKGIRAKNQVIYEMHIGTFTKEGTFRAAQKELKELVKLGVSVLQIMPLNTFPGSFGWGYDGVYLFAPTPLYGSYNDVKSFVNAAHKLGLGVILDVVYNHLWLENPILKKYVYSNHSNEWGKLVNFKLPAVREFFLSNVRYWIEEFHFDGLRLDASATISQDFIYEVVQAGKKAAPEREKLIIAENEIQNAALIQKDRVDALFNDDYHHSTYVRLTGKRDGYCTNYLGSAEELVSLIQHGFLYQGQYQPWQKKNWGTPCLELLPDSFIVYLENHDQIANSASGLRLHQLASPGNYRAMVSYFLLGPNIPMIFQGQEFNSTKPFYYFADHPSKINREVLQGRKAFLSKFLRLSSSEMQKKIPNPASLSTFTDCKLDFKERKNSIYRLYRDLLHLRKKDSVFKNVPFLKMEAATLNRDAFCFRYFGKQEDRLILVNLGADLPLDPPTFPLLVSRKKKKWKTLWSSESPLYGGEGTAPFNDQKWMVLGHATVVLKS